VIELDTLLHDVPLLAPLPPAASRLARIAQECKADVNEVVTVVRYDPDLAAQILAHANAGGVTGPAPVVHVRDAIVRLGIPKILEIAVVEHLGATMMPALPAYGLREGEFWDHATAAAIATEALGLTCGDRIPSAATLAALLHDVGKLLLAPRLDAEACAAIERAVREHGMVASQAELAVLGFTHAQVGERVAETWKLDGGIAAAIRRHHELDTDHGPIADAVRIGNLVARLAGFGLGDEGLNLAADAAACHRLGITQQDFEMICAEVVARRHEAARSRPRAA
jgi:HD-like signal output (HDOD) protein